MGFALPKQEPAVFKKPLGDEKSRLMRMRTALVMGNPFFGLLAIRLKVMERPEVKTAATDGAHFFYNPSYIAGMSNEKLRGLWGHEVMHNVGGHSWRRGSREHRLWNVACDYAIDQVLTASGFDVPNPLVNPDWRGWSAEQIYAALLKDVEEERQKIEQQRKQQSKKPKPEKEEDEGEDATAGGQPSDDEGDGEAAGAEGETGGQPGEGEGDGQGSGAAGSSYSQAIDNLFGDGPTKGEVLDAPVEGALQAQQEWKEAISAAAQMAKSQGNLPSNLEILVEQAISPRVDWKAVLRRFVQMCATNDYDWRRPSSRHAPHGIYLPSLRSETMPPIVIAVDTSGSVGGDELRTFAAELSSIIEEAKPEMAHLVFCDADVQRTAEFMPGDPIVFKPKGGGGTSFKPVFDWVEEQGIEPACLIYLTDMYGSFPDDVPAYPVIWASTTAPEQLGRYTPAFGEVVHLDFE